MDYSDFFKKVLEKTDEIEKPKETIGFDIIKEKTNIDDCKIGGIPYFPKNMEYPTDDKNQPLVLLAQINFDKLPIMKDFPQTGILQFYIAQNDLYGMNWGKLNQQESFRVIYHKDVDTNVELFTPNIQIEDEYMLPFKYEYKLIPKETSIMYADIHTESFKETFINIFNENADDNIKSLFDIPIKSIYDLDDGSIEELCQRNSGNKVQIGGYPFFTQYDPRDTKKEYNDYNIVLFQLDSIVDKEKDIHIMWGDCGVGNFFIPLEKLKQCDFSDVLYNYDCY